MAEAVSGPTADTEPLIATAVAAVSYACPWDHWVQQLKFHAALELANPIAQLCAQAWQDGTGQAGQTAEGSAPRWVLPVPLGTARLRERGYNQAWEIARRMAASLGWPALPEGLLRLHDTAAQSALGRRERAVNLATAFVAAPEHLADLRGAAVLLVDDVWTTGATAGACAQALKAAGVAQVDVCVFAATPPPGSAQVFTRDLFMPT